VAIARPTTHQPVSARPEDVPLGLYVHFPWCVRKCPYCDFNSHPLNHDLPEQDYVDALIADWHAQVRDTPNQNSQNRKIRSVFFGGGTPSLFGPDSFARLIETLADSLTVDAELTMEANPGTLEYGNLEDYRTAGINRLSLGIQSFDDSALKSLGRIHSAQEAQSAIEAAQIAGFKNINVDLMHGLPGQTVAGALMDLQNAIEAKVQHISWYQLTIEPRTEFAQRPPVLPKEETLGEIESLGLKLLADAGFDRYEISAYARNGKQSQHNRNYWEFGDYLGIGAGAHGKLTQAPDNRPVSSVGGESFTVTRTTHPRQPRLYLAQAQSSNWRLESQIVDHAQLPGEFMMNALRLVGGVEEVLYEQTTGQPIEQLAQQLARWRGMGVIDPERLALTPMGLNVLDTVVADFLP